MNFQQLQYIVEIARSGSINKASKKLLISQSSVSASIKELEDELGILIFKRSNRGVEFTRSGKEFLGYATSILEQKEHVENIYKVQTSHAPVHFSVSSQRYPFSEDAFIRFIKKTDSPRFHFALKEAGMDTVIEDVYDHRSDIGVIFLSRMTEKYIRRLLSSKDIEFHEICAIRPCVFMRANHPLAQKKTIAAADLSGYMYLSFEHDRGVALDFSEEFHLLSYKKPPQVINVNDRATAVNVIANTDAISTGSGLLVNGLMDSRMISIPLEGDDSISLGWIKAKKYRLSQQALEFISLLKQSIFDAIAYTEEIRAKLTLSEQYT